MNSLPLGFQEISLTYEQGKDCLFQTLRDTRSNNSGIK